MPAPAPKKRRVVVEISDDDHFEEELSIAPLSSAPQRKTRASTRRAAAGSTPPVANDAVTLKPSLSQTKAIRKTSCPAPLKPKASNNTPAKPRGTTRKSTAPLQKKAPATNKPISSFFTATQRPSSSSSQNARTSVPPASQNEDFDDLIEDAFSDGGFEGSSAVQVGTQTRTSSLSRAGRFKVGGGGGAIGKARMESKGSNIVKAASKVQIVGTCSLILSLSLFKK